MFRLARLIMAHQWKPAECSFRQASDWRSALHELHHYERPTSRPASAAIRWMRRGLLAIALICLDKIRMRWVGLAHLFTPSPGLASGLAFSLWNLAYGPRDVLPRKTVAEEQRL